MSLCEAEGSSGTALACDWTDGSCLRCRRRLGLSRPWARSSRPWPHRRSSRAPPVGVARPSATRWRCLQSYGSRARCYFCCRSREISIRWEHAYIRQQADHTRVITMSIRAMAFVGQNAANSDSAAMPYRRCSSASLATLSMISCLVWSPVFLYTERIWVPTVLSEMPSSSDMRFTLYPSDK